MAVPYLHCSEAYKWLIAECWLQYPCIQMNCSWLKASKKVLTHFILPGLSDFLPNNAWERSCAPLTEVACAVCSERGMEGFQKAAFFVLAFLLNNAISPILKAYGYLGTKPE